MTIETIKTLDDKAIAEFVRNLAVQVTIGKRELKDDAYVAHYNVADLPLDSLARIVAYGGQRYINDKCGGADVTHETKVETANGIIEDLKAGKVGRVVRAAVSNVDKVARSLARKALKAKYVAEGKDYKDFTGLTAHEQDERLDAIIEKTGDHFIDLAKAEIKRIEDLANVDFDI